MKVRILKLGAGPSGIRNPGEIHEVSQEEAAALFADQAAMAAEDEAVPEAAIMPEAPETTELPKPKARGRRG